MVLSIPHEPVHLMAEDDVLHQLRGVAEHGAGAHDALEGNFLSRSWAWINLKWHVEVSKEGTIVIFILDILHGEENAVALKTPECSLHNFYVFLGSLSNHCIIAT